MAKTQVPGLFGLKHTNRDFLDKKSWGKNMFNTSFPVALCCYLQARDLNAVSIEMSDGELAIDEIQMATVFKTDPLSDDTYFAFETSYSPYQPFVSGSLPRTDIVVMNTAGTHQYAGFEIKLTAIPDTTTCEHEDESLFGSELVVRPDTVVYLACSIIESLGRKALTQLFSKCKVGSLTGKTDAQDVIAHVPEVVRFLQRLACKLEAKQTSFLLQPIWKTQGKVFALAEQCLDVFVWSNAGFLSFVTEIAATESDKISRPTRTAIWLYMMLHDYVTAGRFDFKSIIDEHTFNTKNDKAFASSGAITNKFMACDRLTRPLIGKQCLRKIVLGGGHKLLSPERRFDAVLHFSQGLFD